MDNWQGGFASAMQAGFTWRRKRKENRRDARNTGREGTRRRREREKERERIWVNVGETETLVVGENRNIER